MTKQIYLDHAATTAVRQEVIDAMTACMSASYGNPSSLHTPGAKARRALDDARERIAAVLRVPARDISFTSGGTESDNWAVKGTAYAAKHRGRHIITSKIEHPAVLHACRALEKDGFEVTYLDVDADGIVDADQLKRALRSDTVLVSIMAANNEIGTMQPIDDLGRIVKENSRAVFHVDAVQAAGAVDLALDRRPYVDLVSVSAHKFYGPKGTGLLYIRKGTSILPLHAGGGQEHGRRGGTENVPGIVGMAKALELSAAEMSEESRRQAALRDGLIDSVLSGISGCRLNGHRTNRLPNNANFSFDGIEGEALLMRLDAMGIAVSTGSACSSASLDPSHVLLAIGLSPETAHGSCRITLGRETTAEDIETTVDALKQTVAGLRAMSPLWEAAQ